MKKLLLFFATILILNACSNEFDLTEDWKDITVVYGLLDQSQSVQYIRVEKAFLDPKTSAITIAQVADSLYYDNIKVELQAFQPNGSGGTVHQLQRVNAVDEGFTRAEGTFATAPNYLYKLTAPLDEELTYRLVVTKNDGSEITAETEICEDFELTRPIDISTTLQFKSGSGTSLRWNGKSNAKFFNLKLLIHIKEAPANNPTNFQTKTLVWEIPDYVTPNENGLAQSVIQGENFYEFIASKLETGYVRELEGISIKVGAGAEDLLKYLEIGQVNAGITGADVIPIYTNLSGDSYGVFSSRYYKTFGSYGVNAVTEDSLSNGYRTNDLGF